MMVLAILVLIAVSIPIVASTSSAEAAIRNTAASAAEVQEAGGIAGLAKLSAGEYQSTLKHIVFIVLGVGIATLLSHVNYRMLGKFAIPIGVTALVLLVAVPIFGDEVNGATRWVTIAGTQLQPSELAKPALLLLAVWALYRLKVEEDRWGEAPWVEAALPAAIIVASLILIIVEPDKGTTLIIGLGLLMAYWLLELPLPRGAFIAGVLSVALFVGVYLNRPGYESQRLGSFIGRWLMGQPPADQVYQAELALGSGGIFGLGPGQSRQKYSWLPESQNDFILAIIGEELGLVGTLAVVGAFVALFWGAWQVTVKARDRFGRALAGGAITMIGVQAGLNVYSVLGMGPVTGKPLPFVTLGGSSTLAAFILLGLILSVARYGGQCEPELEGKRPRVRREQGSAPERDRRSRREVIDARRSGREREVDDEDSLEWGWHGGAHLPGAGRGR